MKRWGKRETGELYKLVKIGKTIGEIAAILGRTPRAVSNKWSRLAGVKRVTSTDGLAYLAGLIDGDGYLGIICSRKKTAYSFYPSLKIAMTSPLGPEKGARIICSIISKRLRLRLRVSLAERARQRYPEMPIYSLQVGSKSLSKLLPSLIPFLAVKQETAKYLLELIELKKQGASQLQLANTAVKISESIKTLNSIHLKAHQRLLKVRSEIVKQRAEFMEAVLWKEREAAP